MADLHETPNSASNAGEFGAGMIEASEGSWTAVHMPADSVTMSGSSPPLESPYRPTAVQEVAEVHETPNRKSAKGEDEVAAGLSEESDGSCTALHVPADSVSMSGSTLPLVSSYTPTAVQEVAEVHETPLSESMVGFPPSEVSEGSWTALQVRADSVSMSECSVPLVA
jgi:hypothetical protein